MKVVQISAFSGWGCTGRIAYGIDRALVAAGHESVIAWGRKNTAPQNVHTIQIGNVIDQAVHGLYARLTDHAGFGSKIVTKKFLKELDTINPDIIHLQIMHGYYINLELLFQYIKEKNIPVVWTFHDGWAFTGHCPCYCYNLCDKWKEQCCDCNRSKYHPVSWFIDDSRKNYLRKMNAFTGVSNMTIVTPSRWFASKVKESFFKEYPVQVIHNGINVADFKPMQGNTKEKYDLQNKKIILGVSSTWTKEKGIDDFAELANMVSEEYQIILVGLQPKQMEQLPDSIIKIGHTDSVQELAMLYTDADVFVNATYEDNYPTSNLEAIACGTPVITYDVDGSIESVQESSMGKIVEPGNIKALYQAIQEVTNISEEYKNRGLVIDQQLCYQEYVELYEEIYQNRYGR